MLAFSVLSAASSKAGGLVLSHGVFPELFPLAHCDMLRFRFDDRAGIREKPVSPPRGTRRAIGFNEGKIAWFRSHKISRFSAGA